MKTSDRTVAVYGAYGHTGRFVVAELYRRGWVPILSGRDAAKLAGLADERPESETRVASVDDPASLDRMVAGASAVLNCAGPFADTAGPLIQAALRSGMHYLDIAAEQPSVRDVFERYSRLAREAGVVVAPAMAYYGGLGDLLATTAMGNWATADEILVATALDSWRPTRGTRLTGRRNPGQHVTFSDGQLQPVDPLPRTWDFPPPFGQQEVVGLSLAETITASRHLKVSRIQAYINLPPIADITNPETPPPTPVDESGRSAQIFLMDVVARRGAETRRAVARGQDIYAATAPIIVEATERVLSGRVRTNGALAAGEAFDAQDFLNSLAPTPLSLELH